MGDGEVEMGEGDKEGLTIDDCLFSIFDLGEVTDEEEGTGMSPPLISPLHTATDSLRPEGV